VRIRDPGFYELSAADYHADPCEVPSLSSSLAKVILNKTPLHAWLKHPRLNPNYVAKDEAKFDLGSVAHELILGVGGGFKVLDFADYRSKAAQEARKAALDDGATPILREQYERAAKMALSVQEQLCGVADFQAMEHREHVMIWRDIGGPICRAMVDAHDASVIWDIKTTEAGLSDGEINRTIVNLGYDLSAAFYIRGMTALAPELAGRIKFLWCFVECEEPFGVRIVEASGETLAIGDKKAALAIEKWRKCMEFGAWPGYPRDIMRSSLPAWAENAWLERELTDPDSADAITLNSARMR
jgi:PDDEXK-like domain of unknown function (DUF3799)